MAGLVVLAGLTTATSIRAAGTRVEFTSLTGPWQKSPVRLSGILHQPDGAGPYPAVVLLHDCRGMNEERDRDWALRLVSWGMVALRVDSFAPRGIQSACDRFTPPAFEVRALDAYGGARFLQTLPAVDRERIAVMGWEHGAWTLTFVLNSYGVDGMFPGWRDFRFKAGIWFYHYACRREPYRFYAPLLILVGGKGVADGAAAQLCAEMAAMSEGGGEPFRITVLRDAHQGFDWQGKDELLSFRNREYRVQYAAGADARASDLARSFLAEQLGVAAR